MRDQYVLLQDAQVTPRPVLIGAFLRGKGRPKKKAEASDEEKRARVMEVPLFGGFVFVCVRLCACVRLLCLCVCACAFVLVLLHVCARACTEKNHPRLCRSFARGAQLRSSSLEAGLLFFDEFVIFLDKSVVIVCSTQ